MSDAGWIVIPNWNEFQHYPERDPIWIKNYRALLNDEDYLSLTPSERSLLHGIWLAYARSDGQLRHSTTTLQAQLRQRVLTRQLERLKDAGWIRVRASKPIALARARARSQEETKPDLPKKVSKKPRRRVTGFRLVHGTHGITYVPDPNGTDKPPADARL